MLNYLQNQKNDDDQKHFLKNLFLSPRNSFIRKQITMMIERVNSQINDKNYEKEEQAANESIQPTQLT